MPGDPRPYLQHGSRHHPDFGTDKTIGVGVRNDWVIATTSFGTVTNGSAPVTGAFSSIDYQTDDGSIFGVDTSGATDSIAMLVVGTYLLRARATFIRGRTGTVETSATIGGPVTTYDYDVSPGGSNYTDIGPGEATWSQLVVVNDLSAVSGAYMTFTQTTGSNMVSVGGQLQIFRLT